MVSGASRLVRSDYRPTLYLERNLYALLGPPRGRSLRHPASIWTVCLLFCRANDQGPITRLGRTHRVDAETLEWQPQWQSEYWYDVHEFMLSAIQETRSRGHTTEVSTHPLVGAVHCPMSAYPYAGVCPDIFSTLPKNRRTPRTIATSQAPMVLYSSFAQTTQSRALRKICFTCFLTSVVNNRRPCAPGRNRSLYTAYP